MRPSVAAFVFAACAAIDARVNAMQQSAPVALRPGATVVDTLRSGELGSGDSAAVRYRIEGGEGPWTIEIGSPDFLPRLDTGSGADARSSTQRVLAGFSMAWLTLEPVESEFPITLSSRDGREGEFFLTVRSGELNPGTDREEQFRLFLEGCEVLAGHAGRRGEHERAAGLCDKASRLAFALGDPERARRLALQESAEAEKGSLAAYSVKSRINLGACEQLTGNLARALEILASTGPSAEAQLSASAGTPAEAEWARLVCFLHDSLGDLHLDLDGVEEALPEYRRAAEIAPRSPSVDAVPIALSKLAYVLGETGRISESRATIDRALAAAEKADASPETLAQVLWSFGLHLNRIGESLASRDQCERGLSLDLPPRHRIALLGVLAEACIELGRYESAQAALDEIGTLGEQNAIGSYEIATHIERSVLAFRLGDLVRSREQLELALEMENRSSSRRHRIEILVGLAKLHDDEGDPARALAFYEEALEACRDQCDQPREALVLIALGGLHERSGDQMSALEDLRRARDRAEGDARTQAVARAGMGYVLYRRGDFEAAREMTTVAAIDLARLGANEAASDAEETLARIGLARRDLPAVESALQAAEALLEANAVSPAERFSAIGLRSRFAGGETGGADWDTIEQDLAARKIEAARSELERTAATAAGWSRAQRWKARMLLERMSGDPRVAGRSVDRAAFDLPQVGPGSAVLEYVRGTDRLYAYAAGPESVHFVDLGPRTPIESAARELVTQLASGKATPPGFAAISWDLYRRIIAPLLELLPPGTKKLTVIPTADLSCLPFDALVTRVPKKAADELEFEDLSYLIDDHPVACAPSASVLARLQKRPPCRGPRRFLVLGDPVYRDEIESQGGVLARSPGSRSLIDLERLPATREETREIAQFLILEDSTASDDERRGFLETAVRRSATLSTKLFDLRLGANARIEDLPAELASYTNLHFAVHGHVDGRDSRHSGLVLSWDPESQGLFSLEDLLGLRLDADLVVLSACDTAAGPIVRGEGVQSLASAFVEAGARSVIASLWKVPDPDAAQIMKELYRAHLGEKVAPAEALRGAKLAYRASRATRGKSPGRTSRSAHPGVWSAFLFIGP